MKNVVLDLEKKRGGGKESQDTWIFISLVIFFPQMSFVNMNILK